MKPALSAFCFLLSAFRLGRCLLHAGAVLRHGHWKWHLAGIAREFVLRH